MKVAIFANTDWYLYNFRRSFALALRDAGFDIVLLSPPGDYVARLQALGLDWREITLERRSLNPWREFRTIRQIARLLRREQVDLLHGFTIKCAIYGSLAARFAGVPARISAVAGLGFVFASNSAKAVLLRPLVRGLLRAAMAGRNTRLILQNPDDAASLVRHRVVDRTKVRLILGSGVNCQTFYPASEPNDGPPLRVLLATRLLWEKGLREYVEAARRVRASGRPVHFLLAGTPDTGNPNSVDTASLDEWVGEGAIEWLGHVDDMPALLRSTDVVVLPSYYGEGLPKSLIEAAASGCALVTTDMPGCREVVEDGVTGLLVPARDSEALAAAIARLDQEPELRLRLGKAAREKALASFDEHVIFAQTLEVYREVLGDTARAASVAKSLEETCGGEK